MLSDFTDEDQRRLVSALESVRAMFDSNPGQRPLVIRPLRPGDLGLVVHRHGVVYTQEYGWDESFEAFASSPSTSRSEMRGRTTLGSPSWMVTSLVVCSA